MTGPRKIFTGAERLEIGRKVHERVYPGAAAAARELGVAASYIWGCTKLYRESIGFISQHAIAASEAAKRFHAMKKASMDQDAEARKEKRRLQKKAYNDRRRKVSNGHAEPTAPRADRQVAIVPDLSKYEEQISILERQNADLRDELQHALRHSETLQKLLMTVGTTL